MEQELAPVIVDVRAAGPGLPLRERIPGARHIDLATLETISRRRFPGAARIVTYCDCPERCLGQQGRASAGRRGLAALVLAGGLGGWVAAGYPLESL